MLQISFRISNIFILLIVSVAQACLRTTLYNYLKLRHPPLHVSTCTLKGHPLFLVGGTIKRVCCRSPHLSLEVLTC